MMKLQKKPEFQLVLKRTIEGNIFSSVHFEKKKKKRIKHVNLEIMNDFSMHNIV